jgi:L-idonate 5-dehydrogenase
MTAKELVFKGSFRFHHEFPLAVEMMERGVVDVRPLISETFDLADAGQAFERAGDR